MRVITANVNGIRAAARRGMVQWLEQAQPDALALQEVRAGDVELGKVLADAGLAHWSVAHTEGGPLTVVSAYVHTGEADTERQVVKYAFLDAITRRLDRAAADSAAMVVTGDLNIAHREADLKNWKGNLRKSGFLPEERAYLDRWFEDDAWVDVQRRHAGDVAGPYSWWSWRGKAFDNDAGWRIDYQLASRRLSATARHAYVDRAPTYAERWSDHAPVVVDYDLTALGRHAPA